MGYKVKGGKDLNLTSDIVDYGFNNTDPYDMIDRLKELSEALREKAREAYEKGDDDSIEESEIYDETADDLEIATNDLEEVLDRLSDILNDRM